MGQKADWNEQKYMTSHKWVQNFMQPPIFGCTKRYNPHPICTNPPPLIDDRSLNTPHQRHYSSYLSFNFRILRWCRELCHAPFSPNYVRLKIVWGLLLLLVAFYLQVLWNLILVVTLYLQTGYTAPIVMFRLNECNRF